MDLVSSSAVKVPVKSYERWTFAVVAVLKPLARRPYVMNPGHVSLGAENYFRLFTFRYFL